jgi:DNA-binding HxlR family transcriptional regulator
LEKDGLVARKVYGKKPPIKVVYSLTHLGKTFIPVLEAITTWGNDVVKEQGEFVYTK